MILKKDIVAAVFTALKMEAYLPFLKEQEEYEFEGENLFPFIQYPLGDVPMTPNSYMNLIQKIMRDQPNGKREE